MSEIKTVRCPGLPFFRIPRWLYVPAAILLVLATGFLDIALAMKIVPVGWALLFIGRASDFGRLSWSVPGLVLAAAELGSHWLLPHLRAATGLTDTMDLFVLLLAVNFGFAVLLGIPASATKDRDR